VRPVTETRTRSAATGRSTRALTTTEAAVLALLAIEGENSGYDLLKNVSKAIGHVWAPAKSQLYALLPRLVRDELATSRRVVQTDRPDKTLYRISEGGCAAVADWLETVEPGNRDAFYLRLFVGGLTTPEVLVRHVEAFREHNAEQLETLRALVPTNTRRGHDAFHWHLLRLGVEQHEQLERWAEDVLADLRLRAGAGA
jgi:PadR family transcriptional regulator, regulatory protein AphA